MKSNVIPFRLRPGRDDDIVEALAATPKGTVGQVIRAALRLYFQIEKAPTN